MSLDFISLELNVLFGALRMPHLDITQSFIKDQTQTIQTYLDAKATSAGP